MPNAPPLIAVGGIRSPQDALRARQAGAALVQICRAFVESGSAIIASINTGFDDIIIGREVEVRLKEQCDG